MRSHIQTLRLATWSGALFALCMVAPVYAGQPDASQASPTMTAESPVQSDADADTGGLAQELAPATLDDLRGGSSTVTTNTVDIVGDVSGNTAQDVVSGTNLIDGGSFGNMAGLATVIQNSGANVLIQNGMVLNIQFLPQPGP